MADPAKKIATYQDVLEAPDYVVAEVLGDVLYTQPRPAIAHSQAATTLGEELGPPFKRGRGGPGGWIILDEPELHLSTRKTRPDILVPDLAGWRRERLPELPDGAYFELAPDWVCEVLSPSTQLKDRTLKLPIYARENVRHVWLVEPTAQTLEVFRLDGDSYRLVGAYGTDAVVRAEPFDAIELNLALLWSK